MVAPPLPREIVSGGQSGVDRAALDVALAAGMACGGWCPRGRRAEDGAIAARYPLRQTESGEYEERTRLNVRDSNATLILCRGTPTGGTALTARLAKALRRPAMIVDLVAPPFAEDVRAWIEAEGVAVLNVAGPRESNAPGIYEEAVRFLQDLLSRR